MNGPLRRAIPAYLAALLALAALGATNQAYLSQELSLMRERERVRNEVVQLRVAASSVQGPLAVARWASEHGMVPAPEVDAIEHVFALPAPPLAEPVPEGLEVRTVWR